MANYNLINMAHLGLGAFPELNSKVIQSVAFTYRKAILRDYIGSYNRLFEKDGVYEETEKKEKWLLNGSHRFNAKQNSFDDIPGKPVVYWASPSMFDAFRKAKLLSSICDPKQGLITGDNERFLRTWTEVGDSVSFLGTKESKKWYPINKGGDYRKWYGNRDYVLNWENDGYEIKNFKDSKGKLKSRPQNLNYNFKRGISWSLVTTAGFAVRYYDESFTFNVAGITCFPENSDLYYLLGLLNTKVVQAITRMLNPTINMNVGDVARIPVIVASKSDVSKLAEENIDLSKKDWDSFETSWDFKKHPLV